MTRPCCAWAIASSRLAGLCLAPPLRGAAVCALTGLFTAPAAADERADGSDYVLIGSFSTTARDEADPSSFAVLHDGDSLRLYMLADAGASLHQFGFDPASNAFEYGHSSIPEIEISGTPAGADWSGWGMLHDGERYRLYGFASAAHDTLAQHAYDPSTQRYEYGFESIPQIGIELAPADGKVEASKVLFETSPPGT